ncbi:MAG: HIT domain-containing protein, partial [Candidatus Aenigmarchaeota archaeon]|nr:HIT domain-containing protein [Candidatus Aenigmarchaeota archaeon]
MNDCIFCKIINGEIPSFKVYEDENCVAFLDVMPRSKGMCLVVPKKHYVFFDEDFNTSSKLFDAALIVGEKLKKSLE